MSNEPEAYDDRICRFTYKKLGFGEGHEFFPDYYRELCAASARGDKTQFAQLANVIGEICVKKLLAGDDKFFSAIARTLKLWPPREAETQQFVSSPVWASAWRFFSRVGPVEYSHRKFVNLSGRIEERKEMKRG
jgi:hypothetical protein